MEDETPTIRLTTPTWHQANKVEVTSWIAVGAIGVLLAEGLGVALWLLAGGVS